MRTIGRRATVVVVICGAATLAAGGASAHGKPPGPPKQPPLHAVLNGVMDTAKTKLGRFNFRFHVSGAGVVTGHGNYNGGVGKYVALASISTFSCSANNLTVTGTALLNNTEQTAPITITATDGGSGVGSSSDHFSISFGSYSRSGSPVAGKVFVHNCP